MRSTFDPGPGGPTRDVLARLKPALRLIGYVVLLPLGLLALGLWQVDRAGTSLAGLERSRAELPGVVERLREFSARNPLATIRFEGTRQAVAAPIALGQAEARLAELPVDLAVATGRRWLALTALAGSAVALLTGLAGLLGSAVAGRVARRSRESLVATFSLVHRALPAVLTLQIASLSAAVLGASLFEAGGLWFAQKVSAGELKLLMGAALLAVAAVWAGYLAIRGLRRTRALFTPEPIGVFGRAVGEAEAPGLWRLTRELARRQEAPAPDHVVIGLTEGFFVTSAAVRLWPQDVLLPPGRTLYLPASYLGLLDMREVAAIVGHELAHFSGEDTLYSQRFAPIYAGMEHAFATLARDGEMFVLWPALALGGQAIASFDRAVAHWSRLREFEADRRGSGVSGPEGAASALLRTSLAAPLIGEVLGEATRRPERAGDDLVARMVEVGRGDLGDPRTHLEDRQPHPTDSHPPVSQRLAALGVAPDAALFAHAARPAGSAETALPGALFADWPGLCRVLSADLVAEAGERQALFQAELEEVAEAAPAEETELHENGRIAVWTFGIMAAAFAAGAAALQAFAGPIGLADAPLVQAGIVGLFALAALGAALFAAAVARRGRRPFLVLTAEALHSPLLAAPVPWLDVAAFQVMQDQGLALVLAIDPGAPEPRRAGRSSRARFSRRKRWLTLSALGVRGMDPETFADLVGRYLDAARARAMLSARQAA